MCGRCETAGRTRWGSVRRGEVSGDRWLKMTEWLPGFDFSSMKRNERFMQRVRRLQMVPCRDAFAGHTANLRVPVQARHPSGVT
jgi:hypothetical protein